LRVRKISSFQLGTKKGGGDASRKAGKSLGQKLEGFGGGSKDSQKKKKLGTNSKGVHLSNKLHRHKCAAKKGRPADVKKGKKSLPKRKWNEPERHVGQKMGEGNNYQSGRSVPGGKVTF